MEKNVIIILIAAAIVLIGVIYSLIRNNAIKKNGTETEAVVSRITDDTTVNEDGTTDTRYTYFVRFRTPEGKELEVQLGGATNRLKVGDPVRIKYRPEKPNYALRMK